MNWLNCPNFLTAHAFLTGWHLFTFLTVAPFLCIEVVVQKFSVKRCSQKFRKNSQENTCARASFLIKLEAKAWKFLLCVPQKVFGVYIFPNFVLIVVQKLVKANPRCLNTFCLFLLFACNCSNLSKQEAKHSIKTCQSKEKNSNQIYLNSNIVK